MVATAAAAACLVPATAACFGYLVPALAGLRRRRPRPRAPVHRFAVLVPAHDEELSLPRALASVVAQDYPAGLVRVYVIADNCSDGTAAVAWAAGATCFERADPARRGKGRALAFGLERLMPESPDVILILDADCELAPDSLSMLDALFAQGAEVAQSAVRSVNADDGPAGFVAAVGAAFDAGTAAGWDALGCSVPLRGTGMTFRRAVLERVPWDAFGAVEDAEYAARLRRAGVRVRYCPGAEVRCKAPPSVSDLCRQRRRWRGAGLLASKPLVLGYAGAAIVTGFTAGLVVWPAALATAFALLFLRAVCAVGLTRGRVGLLLKAPAVVGRLGLVTLAGVFRPARGWDRTPRAAGRVE